jgi:hypothetical protein
MWYFLAAEQSVEKVFNERIFSFIPIYLEASG